MRKLRAWLRLFYQVPWCVPQWGRAEWFATVRCLGTGRIVAGPEPARFAAALAAYLGTPYVLPVNRGRTAIELALRALGLGTGDEVLLPSYVCHSVLDGVRRAGQTPAFADVGPDLHLSPETVKAAVTPRTKAVIVPHLFGKAAPVDRIEVSLRGSGIAVIDDAAQSLGARCAGRLVGTFGACGIVSCGPGKTLAGPAGGALVTHDRSLYERAAALPLQREGATGVVRRVTAFWLWRRLRRYTLPLRVLLDRILDSEAGDLAAAAGLASNLEAGIAVEQLAALNAHAEARRRNAARLLELLGPLSETSIFDSTPAGSAVKLVLVLSPDGPQATELIQALASEGIEAQVGYTPCHILVENAMAVVPYTDRVWKHVVCLPLETALRHGAGLARCAEEWRRRHRTVGSGAMAVRAAALGRLA